MGRGLSSVKEHLIKKEAKDEDDTNKSVTEEECAVDGVEIEFRDGVVFVDESRGDKDEAEIEGETEVGGEAKGDQSGEHEPVKDLGEEQAFGDAEFDDERVEIGLAIKGVVLGSVDKIETCDPEKHGEGEDEWWQSEVALDGEPSADWRDGEGEAEEEVTEGGEPFGD